MKAEDNILTANNIQRTFKTAEGTLTVLKGVGFTLKPGETASIMGASGVGKSTLLHILGGLDKPTGGEVTISGEPLKGKSETALAKFRNKRVGFIFQYHYLLEDFTAAENVMIPMLVAGENKVTAMPKAEQLLAEVGLEDRRTHRPSQLSGGEQQRIAVARALANEPKLLFADEPSGNLDTQTGRMLHQLFDRLNKEKQIAFVIATHNQELAAQCQYQYRLENGSLTTLG